MAEIDRRNLIFGTTALASLAAVGAPIQAAVPAGRDQFDYEVTRTESEWRAMLGEDYAILRGGETELPRSSALWAEARQGTYSCRGCELPQYDSVTKVNLLKGWAFFSASLPNSQMMSQDTVEATSETPSEFDVAIEVHCRRCGSHMGHILQVEGLLLHCINGASLTFTETAA